MTTKTQCLLYVMVGELIGGGAALKDGEWILWGVVLYVALHFLPSPKEAA